MPDLSQFTLDDVGPCAEQIRSLVRDIPSIEEGTRRIVRYLYSDLREGPEGRPACPLVRLYKTHRYGDLPQDLQAYAAALVGQPLDPEVRCLTLLATAGDREEWNERTRSLGHQAIPLPSPEMVTRLPMVMQLITQLGLDVDTVLAPHPDQLARLAQRVYDVFHVEEAVGSPHIPAQDDFVVPNRIRSAVGFGGMIYTGDFYAVVLFSRVPIARRTAEAIKLLSLSVRVGLLPRFRVPLFDPPPSVTA